MPIHQWIKIMGAILPAKPTFRRGFSVARTTFLRANWVLGSERTLDPGRWLQVQQHPASRCLGIPKKTLLIGQVRQVRAEPPPD